MIASTLTPAAGVMVAVGVLALMFGAFWYLRRDSQRKKGGNARGPFQRDRIGKRK